MKQTVVEAKLKSVFAVEIPPLLKSECFETG